MSNNIITLMDQFFDETLRPISSGVSRALGSNPALNVQEYPDRYEITVTIPGIDPSKIKIELNDKVLDISYEHQTSNEEDNSVILRQEYSHFSFNRRVGLPKGVDSDSIKAKSNKGILTVTINKLPQSQPKKVEVSVEN